MNDYDKQKSAELLTVCAGLLRKILPMDCKYYTHFVLTEFDGNGFGEFTGVVHLDAEENTGFCSDDARRMLAQNFDVDVQDLHIIQFSQLH